MSLFGKVRVLFSALVRKPFGPTPQKTDLEEAQAPGLEETRQAGPPVKAGAGDLPDSERVADLIARQERDAG